MAAFKYAPRTWAECDCGWVREDFDNHKRRPTREEKVAFLTTKADEHYRHCAIGSGGSRQARLWHKHHPDAPMPRVKTGLIVICHLCDAKSSPLLHEEAESWVIEHSATRTHREADETDLLAKRVSDAF